MAKANSKKPTGKGSLSKSYVQIIFPPLKVKVQDIAKIFKNDPNPKKLSFHFQATYQDQLKFSLLAFKKNYGKNGFIPNLLTELKGKELEKYYNSPQAADFIAKHYSANTIMQHVVPLMLGVKAKYGGSKPIAVDNQIILNQVWLWPNQIDNLFAQNPKGTLYFIPFFKKFNPLYVSYDVNGQDANPCPPDQPPPGLSAD